MNKRYTGTNIPSQWAISSVMGFVNYPQKCENLNIDWVWNKGKVWSVTL